MNIRKRKEHSARIRIMLLPAIAFFSGFADPFGADAMLEGPDIQVPIASSEAQRSEGGGFHYPATGPVPAEGRLYVDPGDIVLSWTMPEGNPLPAVGFDVRLDEDRNIVEDPDGTAAYGGYVSADLPAELEIGALETGRTYFWRVDTMLEDGSLVVGVVWQFTTETIDIPGVVIDYSPDPQYLYIGSPSIACMADGTYVASHDFFGPCSGPGSRTAVFKSTDGGRNWEQISTVYDMFWASLFLHEGALYLMGTSGGGVHHCVIRRSDDGGVTWTDPTDPSNGLLLPENGYHTAPVPVVIHNGRIWRAMEDRADPGDWAEYFRSFMMSAPVGADLLDAANWTCTNRLSHNENAWVGTGWLEGNAVVTPDGEMVNILRVAGRVPSLSTVETAAVVRISPDGLTAIFDPENDFIDFPGGGVKFTIRFDDVSGLYWTLVNKQRDPYAMRNRLYLTSSPDLRTWTVEGEVLAHWDFVFHAWQYIDWLFEGDDIVFVSRTAHPSEEGVFPHDYHDANFMTFHRIHDFRHFHGLEEPPCFIRKAMGD